MMEYLRWLAYVLLFGVIALQWFHPRQYVAARLGLALIGASIFVLALADDAYHLYGQP
jgi:hypothetical protein